MGVNCRLIACSRVRDNRARGIEKARTKKREETEGRRGGLRLSLSRLPHFFSPFPYSRALRSLSESLEQASRHTTYRIKEEPRIKHLKWLTCDFASCRKRTQTSGSFICRFGLHWFRAESNVCDGQKLFLSFSFFKWSFNSYELFIIRTLDGVIYNSRYSNCK